MSSLTERAAAQPLDVASQAAPRTFRPDIQGLRAVAILLVVLWHAHVPLVRAGYVGVDVFFVISGFLITGKLVRDVETRGRIHFGDFYLKRVRRLLPAAALVAIVTVLAARLWAPTAQVRTVTLDAIFTTFYGMNYRLAERGLEGPLSPLQHYWSLAVEEQFYLVWPVLIAVVVLAARAGWHRALIIVLVVGAAISLSLSELLLRTNGLLAFLSLQSRAWELCAGALVALTAGRWARLPQRWAASLSWLGLALILASAAVYVDDTPFPGLAATVPVAGAVAVIAAGCLPQAHGAESGLLRFAPMQGMGKVSYSWYLWHWPVLVLAGLAMPGVTLGWLSGVALMALALALAALTWVTIEGPAQHSPLNRRRWVAIAILTSGATVTVALFTLLSL